MNNRDDLENNFNTDIRWTELQRELALLSSNILYLESNENHFLHLSELKL